ncbi:MAG TPA: PfaD family polyunsaturated fatty acid/polyketide biosynthesis protein [Anaerolineales bacterium]|nr:PfaD family polyunsaturated fatty acid/polyketide biosynthesis protein [Anaerolineales bacterium]
MNSAISISSIRSLPGLAWQDEGSGVHFTEDEIRNVLLDLARPVWAVEEQGRLGFASGGKVATDGQGLGILGLAPALPITGLGDQAFCKTYGTPYAYYTGAMASGIASEDLVIAMGKAGFLSSFGAGGLSPARVEAAIQKIKAALPDGPYAFNLLNSPNEPATEQKAVDLYLKYQIRAVEASAYLAMTAPLVQYRVAGLSQGPDGQVVIGNRVIGKLSRLEMAQKFLEPAPADLLKTLLDEKKITPQQAELAGRVPMADDITVEADSGGHTDNRPLVGMLPAFLALRNQLQEKYHFAQPVRVGAAGGIGTPDAALAAFMLGAAYVATGSINQACVESGASEHTRNLLAQADMPDVAMAPAGDMFEMGVRVQVLKRGTMFAMRAQKLYELYTRYNAWEEIPQAEREKLEKTVFKRDFDSIWADTVKFFMERDPHQVERGNAYPKDKMALVFRWYLGLSSRWSASGEKGREMDYQVWCGPSMGAFNNWVKGTYLEAPQNRHVVDIARQILQGCAYLYRVRSLEMQGVAFPACLRAYIPQQANS